MNNENNKQPLGAGIITISILNIIGVAMSVMGILAMVGLSAIDETGELMNNQGGYIQIAVTSICTVITLVSTILILFRKELGVYLYFGITILLFVYQIVTLGFAIYNLLSLVLPLLYLFFIYKKKEIFWSKVK